MATDWLACYGLSLPLGMHDLPSSPPHLANMLGELILRDLYLSNGL